MTEELVKIGQRIYKLEFEGRLEPERKAAILNQIKTVDNTRAIMSLGEEDNIIAETKELANVKMDESTSVAIEKLAITCPAVSVTATAANITAISGSITNTGCTGTVTTFPCTVQATLTWKNIGGTQGTFNPGWSLDGDVKPVITTGVVLNPGETYSWGPTGFDVTITAGGTHTVCPIPN